MTVYEDEWAFWDDIAGRYIHKHAGTSSNSDNIIKAAGYYADALLIERRKRKQIKSVQTAAVSASVSVLG